MKRMRAFFVLLCITLLSLSCNKVPAQESKRTILKFGTLIDVTLYDVEPSLAQKALDQIEANFNQYHDNWSSWQDSPLTRANQKLAARQTAQLHPSIIPLIKKSQQLSKNSHELFNPSINQLI
ncbi:MAG: FAD:protein FMN transferase, partial [Gammaproteobacteria bacterium]|nr:FAD:protein FMN transferase [Gammaproteobacteria bacterium]